MFDKFVSSLQAVGDTLQEVLGIGDTPPTVGVGFKKALANIAKELSQKDGVEEPEGATLKNYNYLEKQEGFEKEAYTLKDYVGAKPGEAVSGVSLAMGVDLAYQSAESLRTAGVSENLILRLNPYLGLKGKEAETYLKAHPLSLSDEQVGDFSNKMVASYEDSLIEAYNNDSAALDYNQLPTGVQEAMLSAFYQYGKGAITSYNYWEQLTNQQWVEALANLRNFGDPDNVERRAEEANHMEKALIKAGVLKKEDGKLVVTEDKEENEDV